jgi:hypothetical protein
LNYYERHIGDYLKDTAHLSLLEHGVYGRLLDVYYTRECGIEDGTAARLVGARSKEERSALESVLNEFFAYLNLSGGMQAGTISPRSVQIATYALCGFANIGSIAIQIGGIAALVPERRGELARMGLKAMVGGLLACYCTACVAGMLL